MFLDSSFHKLVEADPRLPIHKGLAHAADRGRCVSHHLVTLVGATVDKKDPVNPEIIPVATGPSTGVSAMNSKHIPSSPQHGLHAEYRQRPILVIATREYAINEIVIQDRGRIVRSQTIQSLSIHLILMVDRYEVVVELNVSDFHQEKSWLIHETAQVEFIKVHVGSRVVNVLCYWLNPLEAQISHPEPSCSFL
jgi:hypothetical protein